MSTWLRRAFWVGCGLGVVACSVYTEDLLEGTAGGAAAGGTADCLAPSDCAGSDQTCRYRVCLEGTCGIQSAASETACDDNGGSLCDGEGHCVECLSEEQCEPGQSCSADNECQDGKADNGAPCTSAAVCQSDLCVDDYCCSVACNGTCQSCAVSGQEGSCANVPEGTDPDDECPGAAMCSGDGTCEASTGCGNGSPDTGEDCDDNNTDSFDGCSAQCLDPTDHLLISEVAVKPTAGEFVEIYNPTLQAVDLSDVYLADRNDYYLVTQGSVSTGAYDFVVKFPQGAAIASQSFVVVSVKSATDFNNAYGALPDYDMVSGDLGAPAMEGSIGGSVGLTDSGEMLMLFRWNGTSDLVTDIDYLLWGSTTNATDKTGVTVANSTYLADTAAASQAFAPAENNDGETLHRCDTAEASETQTGGNGSSGHDETSEDGSVAWKRDAPASPGAAPASGFCP